MVDLAVVDLAVVGGGVIGLSVARRAAQALRQFVGARMPTGSVVPAPVTSTDRTAA